MCGIGVALLVKKSSECPSIQVEFGDNMKEFLKRRGPDCFSCKFIYPDCNMQLTLCASVLYMRGLEPTSQPFNDGNQNFLLWNGEIFGGLEIIKEECDTEKLFKEFCCAEEEGDILKILEKIHGPWSFAYWQGLQKRLWFGRDFFGRRSLLCQANFISDVHFSLLSVASEGNKGSMMWHEVPADAVYCLEANNDSGNGRICVNRYPWATSSSGRSLANEVLGDSFFSDKLCYCITTSKLSLRNPILNPINKILPSEDMHSFELLWNQEVHLQNQRITSSCNTLEEQMSTMLHYLRNRDELKLVIADFIDILGNAVQVRVENHPFLCKNCITLAMNEKNEKDMAETIACNHSSVAFLFSGGLDSIVLAALADRYIPNGISIDLLNVAFEQPQHKNDKKKHVQKTDATFDTPDRITGRKGLEELQRIAPHRTWKFVEINITRRELQEQREQRISHLIYPLATVLDDSIGCACWFAARGEGTLLTAEGPLAYTSPSRVVLVGMGADEQLGGYSRHRMKFKSLGWMGLVDELAMELDRISSRNLGRDDRIISDHGREARFPFLDENVVSFLNGLPVWIKVNLNFQRGLGEKLILRLVADDLGLHQAAILPKRAIQFGSRIARCEDKSEKGSDLCQRLKSVESPQNRTINIKS